MAKAKKKTEKRAEKKPVKKIEVKTRASEDRKLRELQSKNAELEKKIKKQSEIEEAARLAAESAIQEHEDFNELEEGENVGSFSFDGGGLTEEEENDVDIFSWGEEYTRSKGKQIRYWIKKNGDMLGVKDRPYTFERLMRDHGPGMYEVSVRLKQGGQIVRKMTESIGDPNDGRTEVELDTQNATPQEKPPGFLELFALTNKIQESAESKAQIAAATQASSMSGMMQVIVQSQQQANQQFQMMLMESQKEARASTERMMSLFTTLLTQKPQENKGPDTLSLITMLDKARREGKEEQKSFMDLLDRKIQIVKAEAEEGRGSDDENEGVLKTAIKSIIPILTQAGQNYNQAQAQGPTPEQQEAFIRQQNEQVIAQRRLEAEQNNRRMQAQAQAKAQGGKQEQVIPQRVPGIVEGRKTVQPRVGDVPDLGKVKVVPVKVREDAKANLVKSDQKVRQARQNDIMKIVESDLIDGLVNGQDALKTVVKCKVKLEKSRISLQDVLDAFSLDELQGLAKAGGLLDKDVWLQEFYGHIEKENSFAQRPAPRTAAPQPTPNI